MVKTFSPAENPALRMGKEKAATQLIATKRAVTTGSFKSSVGSFSPKSVVSASSALQRKK